MVKLLRSKMSRAGDIFTSFNKTRDFLQYDTGQVINGQDEIRHSDKNLENVEENLLRRLF